MCWLLGLVLSLTCCCSVYSVPFDFPSTVPECEYRGQTHLADGIPYNVGCDEMCTCTNMDGFPMLHCDPMCDLFSSCPMVEDPEKNVEEGTHCCPIPHPSCQDCVLTDPDSGAIVVVEVNHIAAVGSMWCSCGTDGTHVCGPREEDVEIVK